MAHKHDRNATKKEINSKRKSKERALCSLRKCSDPLVCCSSPTWCSLWARVRPAAWIRWRPRALGAYEDDHLLLCKLCARSPPCQRARGGMLVVSAWLQPLGSKGVPPSQARSTSRRACCAGLQNHNRSVVITPRRAPAAAQALRQPHRHCVPLQLYVYSGVAPASPSRSPPSRARSTRTRMMRRSRTTSATPTMGYKCVSVYDYPLKERWTGVDTPFLRVHAAARPAAAQAAAPTTRVATTIVWTARRPRPPATG